MIVTIQARSEKHAQHIEFRAMMSGLNVDQHGRYLDVTVRDKEKVLGVIKEAGGRVYHIADEVELTKEEMFVS